MADSVQLSDRRKKIGHLLLEGKKPRKIAHEMGLDPTTIYRDIKKKEVQDILQAAQKMAVVHAVDIQSRFLKLCENKDPKIQLDAIKQFHKIAGFTPSSVSNIYINKIMNDNRSVIVDPGVIEALKQIEHDAEVVDAEVIEEGSD